MGVATPIVVAMPMLDLDRRDDTVKQKKAPDFSGAFPVSTYLGWIQGDSNP